MGEMNLPWLDVPWERFLQRRSQQRMAHALLVSGPPGIGKRELAAVMANSLLCLDSHALPCGECRSCKLLAGGAHPDRFFVEPEEGKSVISVDQIRALIGQLVLTTSFSACKVAVMVPAELMTVNAANALLKSLEEPPGETVLILVSDDAGRLPVTIRSRCQLLPVTGPSAAVAMTWLQKQTDCSDEDCDTALEATGGSPLRAAQLVQGGDLSLFSELRLVMNALVGKPSRVGEAMDLLGTLDEGLTWTWLSINGGRALEHALGSGTAHWLTTEREMPAKKLAQLQAKADQNRRQAAGNVRHDLLLKEWLLEWARLPAREPIH